MDYQVEKLALHYALDIQLNAAADLVKQLNDAELELFTDALDKLAQVVDMERIRRAGRRSS